MNNEPCCSQLLLLLFTALGVAALLLLFTAPLPRLQARLALRFYYADDVVPVSVQHDPIDACRRVDSHSALDAAVRVRMGTHPDHMHGLFRDEKL